MSELTIELREKAIKAGFVAIGISSPEALQDLPYGWVRTVRKLITPEEELQGVRSVILLAWYAWDKAFSLNVDFRNKNESSTYFESYYFGEEIMKNKAWTIVDYLHRRGYDAVWSSNIPLKTAAVMCGLGAQGKNSLLISPDYGPRVKLIAVLTDAVLDIDSPFEEDLCKDCDRCIRVCPTQAIEPYRLNITNCMVYSSECPEAQDVPKFVRQQEKKLFTRPSPNSYIECTRCIDVCPIGKK
jgi:epoxyqueuosine reductase